MALKFCSKCKALLSPQKKSGKIFLKCNNCGFFEESHGDFLIAREKIEQPKKIGKGFVDDGNSFATYNNKCKKCGYGKAQVLDMGIFYSDEDNLIFLKCGRCGFSERIGRKTC